MKIGDIITQEGLWRRQLSLAAGRRMPIKGELQGFVVCNVDPLMLYPDPVEWKKQQDQDIDN